MNQSHLSPAGRGRVAVRLQHRVQGLRVAEVRRAVWAAAEDAELACLSVAVVSDAVIADLHRRFMDDPSPTDVLTFDLRDDPANPALEGEIVVSAETAKRQARGLGVPQRVEVLRYVIHGVLHLRGYNDATPAQRRNMRRMEDRILARIVRSAHRK